MQDIKELTLAELEKYLRESGRPAFHARQIFAWIYQKGVPDFSRMSNLSLDLRKQLAQHFCCAGVAVRELRRSQDGTQKAVFGLSQGASVEGVIIPSEKRTTACISTQVGCRFRCAFCASGMRGFKRNMSCAELLEEVLVLQDICRDEGRNITHVVCMGTGEPLDNYDNVIKAIRIMNADWGLGIGARRITISTAGVIPGIRKLQDEGLQVELSVSLHAADEKTRSLLMPINTKYPLKELMAACREYIRATNRQITFEYILIHNTNSRLQDAQNLCTILTGMTCKVNLIPCNTVTELGLEPAYKMETLVFRDCLLKQGIPVTVRRPRGQDVIAACGQLRLTYEKK